MLNRNIHYICGGSVGLSTTHSPWGRRGRAGPLWLKTVHTAGNTIYTADSARSHGGYMVTYICQRNAYVSNTYILILLNEMGL